jgi:WD40 repeat protein
VLASFDPDSPEPDLVQRVMIELVTIGAGGDTRRRATRTEIGEEAWRVVPALTDARLLVTSFDDATGEETAEVAHEALIRHWDRLRAWLNEDREFLLWRQRLGTALQPFEVRPDDDGTLLRGSLLEEAKRWRSARERRLTARELAFIAKSERRARLFRLRRIANRVFVASAVFAVGYGAMRFSSERARNLAMRHASILEAAAVLRDPLTAAQLAAELDPARPPPSGPRIARAIADRAIPLAVLGLEPGGLTHMHVTPDGSRVLTAHDDGRVLRWNADGGAPTELVNEGEGLRDVQLDADGRLVAIVTDGGATRLLAMDDGVDVRPWGNAPPQNVVLARFAAGRLLTASLDGGVSLWPVRGGGAATTLRTTRGTPRDLLASEDGHRVILVIDSLIEVWPVRPDGTGSPQLLRGHRSPIVSSALAAAGPHLVTGSYDGVVRVWDLDAGSSHTVWTSARNAIWRVGLDSAGQRFVVAAQDGSVCTGSTRDTVNVPTCHIHAGEATVARISPDGRRVLSGGTDSTVFVRQLSPDVQPIELAGHQGPILDAMFSRDGSRIVTASHDGAVRVWRSELQQDPLVVYAVDGAAATAGDRAGDFVALAGYDGTVRIAGTSTLETFAVSAGGSPSALALDGARRRVAIGTSSGSVHVRGFAGGSETFDLAGHDSYITSIAFDETGSRIVTASADSTARVWSGAGFSNARVLRGHADLIHYATSDAAGSRVVTASEDGTVRIWSLDGPEQGDVLRHRGPVLHVAFSADGERIASASDDGTIGVWSADGDSLLALIGHERAVSFVEFDARGERLVSASSDQTARVWSLDRSEEPAVLRGHRKQVRTARFSRDGSLVVTASLDSTARVFTRGETGESIVLAHGAVLRDAFFTADQTRVVTLGEDGTIRVWRIGWAALLDYLGSASLACLAVADRIRFLDETAAAADRAYQRCMERGAHQQGDSP